MITRKDVKEQFNRYTANKYIYYDCLIYGQTKVEIKAISNETHKPVVITCPLLVDIDEDEAMAVDWSAQEVKPYNPSKDW